MSLLISPLSTFSKSAAICLIWLGAWKFLSIRAAKSRSEMGSPSSGHRSASSCLFSCGLNELQYLSSSVSVSSLNASRFIDARGLTLQKLHLVDCDS